MGLLGAKKPPKPEEAYNAIKSGNTVLLTELLEKKCDCNAFREPFVRERPRPLAPLPRRAARPRPPAPAPLRARGRACARRRGTAACTSRPTRERTTS